MREIKFRLWNPIGQRFHHEPDVVMSCLTQQIKGQYDHEKEYGGVFEQYTGLKDKNRVEIYEGDILKCEWPKGSVVAVVKFGNPNAQYSWGWQLKRISGDDFNMDILLWVETELDHVSCEVIGNIHETKEESNE